MAARLPRITADQLVRALQRDGWVLDRQAGSHAHYEHPTKPGIVTEPMHRGRILEPKTLASALAQAGLTPDDLRRLL
jgi:predicted RNA binding protein YcfA (HicA-like mRNA interferase family)